LTSCIYYFKKKLDFRTKLTRAVTWHVKDPVNMLNLPLTLK